MNSTKFFSQLVILGITLAFNSCAHASSGAFEPSAGTIQVIDSVEVQNLKTKIQKAEETIKRLEDSSAEANDTVRHIQDVSMVLIFGIVALLFAGNWFFNSGIISRDVAGKLREFEISVDKRIVELNGRVTQEMEKQIGPLKDDDAFNEALVKDALGRLYFEKEIYETSAMWFSRALKTFVDKASDATLADLIHRFRSSLTKIDRISDPSHIAEIHSAIEALDEEKNKENKKELAKILQEKIENKQNK